MSQGRGSASGAGPARAVADRTYSAVRRLPASRLSTLLSGESELVDRRQRWVVASDRDIDIVPVTMVLKAEPAQAGNRGCSGGRAGAGACDLAWLGPAYHRARPDARQRQERAPVAGMP